MRFVNRTYRAYIRIIMITDLRYSLLVRSVGRFLFFYLFFLFLIDSERAVVRNKLVRCSRALNDYKIIDGDPAVRAGNWIPKRTGARALSVRRRVFRFIIQSREKRARSLTMTRTTVTGRADITGTRVRRRKTKKNYAKIV